MAYRRQRQVVGAVGLALVAFVAAVLVAAGPPHSLLVALQLAALGLGGACDIVSAVDSPLTRRVPWYKWSGAGSILLGISIPLGVVPTGSQEGDALFLFGMTVLASLSITAIGVELLLFDGVHLFDDPPDGASASTH